MLFKISIRLLFFLLSLKFCFAQENEGVLEELLLEQISEELGENVDISEVSERLYYLLRHPLDLNDVTESELTNLIFLSPQQVANIIAHREQTGDFISILELQGVVGLDMQTIHWFRQFVKVGQKSSL